MENNRFHQHRTEIAAISARENVDISVACSILAKEKGWTKYGAEERDFKLYVNRMPAHDRAKYFE